MLSGVLVVAAAFGGVLVGSGGDGIGGGVPAGARGAVAIASDGRDCSATKSAADCDVDGDRIADWVEREVCGSFTCATGTEDTDGDGISDGVEVMSCGSTGCAEPSKDADGDGIPDYAERLVCDSDTCSNSTEDADGDGVADWIEFVICGDRACATGREDYNGNGISDADELAACVVRVDDDLASTGSAIAIGLIVAAALALIGGGLWMRRRRSLRAAGVADAGSAGIGSFAAESDTPAGTAL